MSNDHDLSFVAPHRRTEVLRRIRVLERFIAQPGRAAAERAAASLGLGKTQFYRLAGIWRAGCRPEDLTGAGRPRPRRSLASPEQRTIIEAALEEMPTAVLHVVAKRAEELGAAGGVRMPTMNSIRKVIELERAGRLSPLSPAAGADVVVASCAIDIPVASASSRTPTMPVATLVIDTGTPPVVLGVALSFTSGDQPALARALLRAASTWGRASDASMPTVAIEPRCGVPSDALIEALVEAGVTVRPIGSRAGSVMNDAVALLGRKPAGIRLVPGLTEREPQRRRPTTPSGAKAMTMADAEQFAIDRLVEERNRSRAGLRPDRADHLTRRLEGFAFTDRDREG